MQGRNNMAKEKFDSNNIRHVISNGSLNQIREFHAKHFHEIKHTEAFGLLLSRLESYEDLIQTYRNKINELYDII